MITVLRNVYWALFCVLCIVECVSCTQKDNVKEAKCTEITISEIKDSVCFGNLFEEYKYIPLSNKDGYTIGEIYQVLISDEKIYISSDGVFCYDMKGNPLFRINEKGGMKSEILKGTSISIEDGILYLYDERKRVIHKYNSQNGAFIENVSLPESVKEIYKIKGGFIAETFSTTSDFYEGIARFLIYDNSNFSDGPQKKYLSDDLYNFPIYGQVTFNNNSVYFSDYFNNKLFKIDANGCSLIYRINFKNFAPLSSSLINNMLKNNTVIADDNDYQYGLVDMYENQDYFVGNIQGNTSCIIVHDKKSNSNIAFKKISASSHQISPFKFNGTYNEFFVQTIPTEYIMMVKNVSGFGEILPVSHPDFENQRVLLNHADDDNPIIALYKFKKF